VTPPVAVVFDLDGTLVDSRRDLATAVNGLRASYGLPALPLSAVMGMVGEGARLLVARALGVEAAIALDGPDGALSRFYARYDEVLLATTRPYPGIPELLAALAPRLPLAVLSNKPGGFTRRVLAGLGLAGAFAAVVGGDGPYPRKPDPAGLRALAAGFGAPPERVVLVGDSAIDAETAARAGAPFALVAWGLPAPAEREAIVRRWAPPVVAARAGDHQGGLIGSPDS
jgi:phosphoglycolate phosphatase